MGIELKEDDVVMCTVKRIEGTTVFVDIDGNGEGSIVLSEIAAGRIRNLRAYVTVGKKIPCKVLKISGQHIELSLRRVTAKEREYVLEKYRKEKTLSNILATNIKNVDEVIDKIKQDYDVLEFFEAVHQQPSILEKYLGKEQSVKMSPLFAEKAEKAKSVRKDVLLRSFADNGLEIIRQIVDIPDVEIHYLGSSNFSINVSGNDFKSANTKLASVLKVIEVRAKEKKAMFEILQKKEK